MILIMNTNSKLNVAGTVDTEEGADVFRLTRILGLKAVLVKGPGWGEGKLLDCAESVCLAT